MENFKVIAKCLVKAMYYGNWTAETPNERIIQMLLEKEGLWPIKDDDELIEKTEIVQSLYPESTTYFKNKN